VDPGTFMLFNTQTGKFTMLGASMRGIDSKQMAHTELHRYKARDGMEIPAWLTLPRKPSQKNLPLIVLVHGGPGIRGGNWEWDAGVQFLASRGYAVLQPEFRGSEGFGFRHFAAGWKQWGLAMQTDLSDAARWAVAKGIADPARICIGGSGYGGYATLMGLITEPDLFRCGFEWGGITDINMMFEFSTSNLTTTFKNYTMKVTVGDPEKDSAQIKATSPLLLAGKLKQPLLIGHGGADRLVPIDHGIKFKNEASKTNADLEWVEYTQETDRIGAIKNRVDYWTRVEKFLDKNIGAK
jgi:dipeptidyl aminopeptidase/acylaminoacyl peptidase